MQRFMRDKVHIALVRGRGFFAFLCGKSLDERTVCV